MDLTAGLQCTLFCTLEIRGFLIWDILRPTVFPLQAIR